MLHCYYVVHVDPCDAFVRSNGTPKPLRPVSRVEFANTLARFDAEAMKYVEYCTAGWVACHWSTAPYRLGKTVQEFAMTLAENDAASVMTEMLEIIFPAWAQVAQKKHYAKRE